MVQLVKQLTHRRLLQLFQQLNHATSTDIQGQTQTGKPTFTEGNRSKVPMDDDVPATFEDGSTTKTIQVKVLTQLLQMEP